MSHPSWATARHIQIRATEVQTMKQKVNTIIVITYGIITSAIIILVTI